MKAVQEKIDETRKAFAERLKWQEENATIMWPIYQKVLDLGGDFEADNVYGCLRLAGDKHKLAEMVRALRVAGFSTAEAPPQMGQTSWSPTFTSPQLKGGWIWLFFTSTACRRVKIGTKIEPAREVDVYETVCGEVDGNGEPIAPAAAAPADDIPF